MCLCKRINKKDLSSFLSWCVLATCVLDVLDYNGVLQNLDDDLDVLMMFGHNSEFTWLANKLAKTSIENIPTTGVVCLNFGINSWQELDYGKGRQQFFMYPKQFK